MNNFVITSVSFDTQLCIVAALVAACSANPATLYYQSATPLLAKYAPAPLAPASTVHAAHVAAALSPAAYTYTAAAAAPLAYAAAPVPATYAYASPYAYDAGYTVRTDHFPESLNSTF